MFYKRDVHWESSATGLGKTYTLGMMLSFYLFNRQTMHIKSITHNSIAMFSLINFLPVEIRTRVFCLWGGDGVHCATPTGQVHQGLRKKNFLKAGKKNSALNIQKKHVGSWIITSHFHRPISDEKHSLFMAIKITACQHIRYNFHCTKCNPFTADRFSTFMYQKFAIFVLAFQSRKLSIWISAYNGENVSGRG
jgi:hypothetical protein